MIYAKNHIIFDECATEQKPRTDFLPEDVDRVVLNGDSVAVVLTNGNHGSAIRMSDDCFDTFVGFCIAYYKADNDKVYRLKQALEGLKAAADRRGHKQAILRNYDE